MSYNNKSGDRRNNRRTTNQFPISHFKCIPHSWISVTESGQPLKCPTQKSLYFIPMKTPLPEFLTNSLKKQVSSWTPAKAIDKATKLIPVKSNLKFLAINVSQGDEMVLEEDWKEVGASYARCPVSKSYEQNSIDAFCDIINKELNKINNNETLVCLNYCGCGHNRVGFCITAYLARACKIELSDALKRVEKNCLCMMYNQKAVDTLSSFFKTSPQIHMPAPKGIKLDDKVPAIGDPSGLPFEKYNGLKRISKEKLLNEDKKKILSILAEACNDQDILDDYFPIIEKNYWSNKSLDDLQNDEYLISFEPRGLRCFVVVNSESQVFLVIPVLNINVNYSNPSNVLANMNTRCRTEVYELNAKFTKPSRVNVNPSSVAVAYLIEEKRRAVVMTTDLLYIDNSSVYTMPLNDRLGLLYYELNKYLKPDTINNTTDNMNVGADQQAQLQQQQQQYKYKVYFFFRQMTYLYNARRLLKDLTSFFVKCDGISFQPVNSEPLNSIYLPITPSVILLFDYNGNNKSILYARYDENDQNGNMNVMPPFSERTFPLKPISVFTTSSKNSKLNALDRKTSRFELDKKQEWVLASVGHSDPPTTTSELNSLTTFLQKNTSIEDIFKGIDTIISQLPVDQSDTLQNDE